MAAFHSRLAPTPSGFLHAGNIANFLLTEKLVRETGGRLFLRIDDCDSTRARLESVENIFGTLKWLGFSWTEGPGNGVDFAAHFSQSLRKSFYFERLEAIRPLLYACACSRKEAGAVYAGHCRHKNLPFIAGQTALRLTIENPALAADFGDVVLWRKDDGPAYHWVSVVDDLDHGMNLIVRGEDLRRSSELQRHIAGLLTPEGFRNVRFLHHPLLVNEAGAKLAKSLHATAVLERRALGATPQLIRAELAPIIEAWAQLLE